jgi:8-oxo-dGTP pyrophosphatase MutT (NUDIX family)
MNRPAKVNHTDRREGVVTSRKQDAVGTVTSSNVMRISVRAVVLSEGRILVQKGLNDPTGCYAFIGGGYEVGDTFVSRLEREFEEETTARIIDCKYLFVVENRLQVNGKLMQGVDHYFEATLDREDVESKEGHLSQHWLPVATLEDYDLRPWIVRDVIAQN